MIIIQQTHGSSLSNLVVDEVMFQEETGATGTLVASFEYNGANWVYNGTTITQQQLEENYGISFTGTPSNTDIITVAYQQTDIPLHYFSPGNGINQVKINYNFATLQQGANANETAINNIAATALHKNGDNLEQSAINEFKKDDATILSTSGAVSLLDGGEYFLTPTGNVTITLPTIAADQYSHTISLIVAGSQYIVDLGTTYSMLGPAIDTEQTYSVLFLYNKIDEHWYSFMGQ